jgi:hypothetical protein
MEISSASILWLWGSPCIGGRSELEGMTALVDCSEDFGGWANLAASLSSGVDLAAVFIRTETRASAAELTAIERIIGPKSFLYFTGMSRTPQLELF